MPGRGTRGGCRVYPRPCAAGRAVPEEGLLSRPLSLSPSAVLSEAINDPDDDGEEKTEVDDDLSTEDVFADSVSGFSCSRASTAAVVPREKPRWIDDLFVEIMSDDMQGGCFPTQSSSRRATQCPLFPPVQHFFTAAGGHPSTQK